VVAGWGVDLVTARELALKIAEGARLPAVAHDVETLLHGHLAAANRWTGLVLVRPDRLRAMAEVDLDERECS
jgi:glucosamine 6-phosphate synthetase-like amidotransferase/phosphosugar isomerase protein